MNPRLVAYLAGANLGLVISTWRLMHAYHKVQKQNAAISSYLIGELLRKYDFVPSEFDKIALKEMGIDIKDPEHEEN